MPATCIPTGTVEHHTDTFRALFLDLEDWVVNGTEPPPSQITRISDGTLVRPEAQVFPAMKGVTWPVNAIPTAIPDFQYLARYNDWRLLDFGPQYSPQDESGIASVLPPAYLNRDYAADRERAARSPVTQGVIAAFRAAAGSRRFAGRNVHSVQTTDRTAKTSYRPPR